MNESVFMEIPRGDEGVSGMGGVMMESVFIRNGQGAEGVGIYLRFPPRRWSRPDAPSPCP